MNIEPVTLQGTRVRLEPLSFQHHSRLCEIGLDDELWRWTVTNISTAEQMRDYIEDALKQQSEGTALPFATIDMATDLAIGSTRFGNIDLTNRRAEIGWTWVARQWQRTPANTEAKYLMLRHAFETLGMIRVELKTDSLNEKSRNAILRIGAKEEGVFRNHMITASGRIRHSAWFSIIDSEWPQIKQSLEEKLSLGAR